MIATNVKREDCRAKLDARSECTSRATIRDMNNRRLSFDGPPTQRAEETTYSDKYTTDGTENTQTLKRSKGTWLSANRETSASPAASRFLLSMCKDINMLRTESRVGTPFIGALLHTP